jgi:hypothetical protein
MGIGMCSSGPIRSSDYISISSLLKLRKLEVSGFGFMVFNVTFNNISVIS